jgi:hypothetical protein
MAAVTEPPPDALLPFSNSVQHVLYDPGNIVTIPGRIELHQEVPGEPAAGCPKDILVVSEFRFQEPPLAIARKEAVNSVSSSPSHSHVDSVDQDGTPPAVPCHGMRPPESISHN